MTIILSIVKRGNSFYMKLSAKLCRQEKIKDGDYFQIERDVILPDLYTLKRVGTDNGKIDKGSN